MKRVRWVAGMVAFAVVAGACGGSDNGAEGEPEAAATAVPTAAEPAPEPAGEPDPTGTPAPEPMAVPDPTPEPTATPEPAEPFRILLTNDDGVMAEGIDIIAQALLALPDIELTIVAPAENQSGTSDTLSQDPVAAAEATTLSGLAAVAVTGTPGDSVLYALAQVLDQPPHLIVSGINDGQNIGPFARASGTVGAVRVGGREGIPGLAASVGAIVVEPEFDPIVPFVIAWVTDNREALMARPTGGTGPVFSINSPSCGDTGEFNGLLEVPLADDFEGRNGVQIECSLEIAEPANDVEAFISGWASLTEIPEDLVLGVEGA